MPRGPSTQRATAGAPEAFCAKEWWARQGKGPPTKLGRADPRTTPRSQCSVKHPGHRAGAHATRVNHDGTYATRNQQGTRPVHAQPTERGSVCGGWPGQRVEEQGTWASRTRKCSEAGCGWPEDGGVWTAKTVKQPPQQPAQPPKRQLLGATAHHATCSTATAHRRRGSTNAETTPAGAPAAAADRMQRPDATCEGTNG